MGSPLVAIVLSLSLFSAFMVDKEDNSFDAFDQQLRDVFENHHQPEEPYDFAFSYFVTAFRDRARKGGAAADHPGAYSDNGTDIDAFEGFSRIAPVIAAWLASGRPEIIMDLHGNPLDLRQLLHDGIVNGTDPANAAYWQRITNDQQLVEAADVARTLWMVRGLGIVSPDELERAGVWLRQINEFKFPDDNPGNWRLFPVLINVVLRSLRQPADDDSIAIHFRRLLDFYRGDGWFSDGAGYKFDYYNAWAIHYELFWLRQISPGFGGDQIAEAMRRFVENYAYLIGPKGFPILGRSICYRLAAPAPLIAAALDGIENPGRARRALDAIWLYFVKNGAIANGLPTQGYCAVDLRILDRYSGPASCLWGLRSLVLAFRAPPNARFWTDKLEALPIERGSYSVTIPAIGWTLVGNNADYDIQIRRTAVGTQSPPRDSPRLVEYGFVRRLAAFLFGRSYRPVNDVAKYDGAVYSSANPFCGCPQSRQ